MVRVGEARHPVRVASRWYVVSLSRATFPLPSSACQRTVVKTAGSPSWNATSRSVTAAFTDSGARLGGDSAPPDALVLVQLGRAGLDQRHARSPGSGGSAAGRAWLSEAFSGTRLLRRRRGAEGAWRSCSGSPSAAPNGPR